MVDIDDFKNYNDTHGHQAGDLALEMTAQCLKTALRSADVAARYGGEEFSILLPQTSLAEARVIAERLAAPLASAIRLTLLEALTAAAEEITRDLAPGSVEVRLRTGEATFAVTVPTLLRLGSPDPFSMPMAWRISTAAGGVLVMNVKERSSKTVISTGIVVPMSFAVWALNALTNSMMLMPCWPSAGPTGGAGEA